MRSNIDVATIPAPTTTTTTEPKTTELGSHIVTAYSSIESCDYPVANGCLGADGKVITQGAIACPRKYPLGTQFIIDGHHYTCRDRTALRYDGRFDLYMGYGTEAYKKALNWGLRYIDIYQVNQ